MCIKKVGKLFFQLNKIVQAKLKNKNRYLCRLRKRPMIKKIVFLILLVSAGQHVIQADPIEKYKAETFRLYINGHMDQWQNVIDSMQAEPGQTEAFQLDILGYYYGLIGHLMDTHQKEKAGECLKAANDLAARLYQKDPHSALLLGFMSNFTGFQIALTPIRAPFLAKGMMSKAREAIKNGPDIPYVNVLYGNILFYMPDMLGGDSEEALAHYKKALQEMEASPDLINNNWLYIQLLTTIGLVYEKSEKYREAQEMFQKVMKLQPGYAHVRDVIYPRLLKEMQQ